jgi:hypothetical protein
LEQGAGTSAGSGEELWGLMIFHNSRSTELKSIGARIVTKFSIGQEQCGNSFGD